MCCFKIQRSFLAIACCVATLGLVTQASAQSEAVLKWKFDKGQKFEVTTEQVVQTTASVSGQTFETTVVSEAWTDFSITELSDGVAEVESTITRMKMTTESIAGEMIVDTDGEKAEGPGADVALDMVLPMIDKTITMKVAGNGKMTDLQLPKGLGDSLDTILGSQAQQMMKNTMENSLLEFPNKPLKKGDNWEKKITTPSPAGNMEIVTTYEYAGLETHNGKSLHKIDVDMKMDFGNESITIDRQDTTGTIYFDSEAGCMDSSEVKQEVDMTVAAGGQTVKQSLEQTASSKFAPKK